MSDGALYDSPTEGMENVPMKNLGPYAVLRLISSGGMGEVYLGLDAGLNRKVALKVMRPHLLGDSESRERFQREARAAAALNHPGIVAIYAIGEQDDITYFAMEYVGGDSLQTILSLEDSLPPAKALEFTRQTAEALEYARGRGIIHRDIKPANLLLADEDTLKVADFGLAKNLAIDSSLTVSGSILGSPFYISPEQGRSLPADHRSDIYSLGATLFHLTNGSPPFRRRSHFDIVKAHVDEPLPQPAELLAVADGRFMALIGKMMAKNPDNRPQTYEELLAEIAALAPALVGLPAVGRGPSAAETVSDEVGPDSPVGEVQSGPDSSVGEVQSSPDSSRKRRWELAGAGLALAVILIAAGWMLGQLGDSGQSSDGSRKRGRGFGRRPRATPMIVDEPIVIAQAERRPDSDVQVQMGNVESRHNNTRSSPRQTPAPTASSTPAKSATATPQPTPQPKLEDELELPPMAREFLLTCLAEYSFKEGLDKVNNDLAAMSTLASAQQTEVAAGRKLAAVLKRLYFFKFQLVSGIKTAAPFTIDSDKWGDGLQVVAATAETITIQQAGGQDRRELAWKEFAPQDLLAMSDKCFSRSDTSARVLRMQFARVYRLQSGPGQLRPGRRPGGRGTNSNDAGNRRGSRFQQNKNSSDSSQ
ncbi:serine/threonine-protein kinase [Candidatus Sumerlaeota bacterium]